VAQPQTYRFTPTTGRVHATWKRSELAIGFARQAFPKPGRKSAKSTKGCLMANQQIENRCAGAIYFCYQAWGDPRSAHRHADDIKRMTW
jgi:hypothetical protein